MARKTSIPADEQTGIIALPVVEKTKSKKELTNGSNAQIEKPKEGSERTIQIAATAKKPTKVQLKASANAFVANAKKTSNQVALKKANAKTAITSIDNQQHTGLSLTLQLRYHTQLGQQLYILGNHPLLGNGNAALPLTYLNDDFWRIELAIAAADKEDTTITYNYILKTEDGTLVYDWGSDKQLNLATFTQPTVQIIDSWNYAGYNENAFYTEAFQKVLLKANFTPVTLTLPKHTTHILKVKAPLLAQGQTLCVLGSNAILGNWNTEKPVVLAREADGVYFKVALDFTNQTIPVTYKYGVYDVPTQRFLGFEGGNNRLLFNSTDTNKLTILNDGFAVLPTTQWRGTGVAIPVFSLKSAHSFGVGEFADLNLLADWGKQVGLKLIQILPINDTTATHTWADSYPYAAISAFALHPMYLRLEDMVKEVNRPLLAALDTEKAQLNALSEIDYEAVTKLKLHFVQQIYPLQKEATFSTTDFKQYFAQNKHWLVPYSVFCYLRDEYGTADFNEWPAYRYYNEQDIAELSAETSRAYDAIALHYFIQYHLHLQLNAAKRYAHEKGIIVKGDIAIGIYRYGADAWQHPELFHMNLQAGAPPDAFAVKGQNWGFPTYNWQRMRQDGFAWWKQRFEQMSYYFDAFRIDHILGFFRIWSIPTHAVEGIMGYFVPAIPVHVDEFHNQGIWFDFNRYTRPFIDDQVLYKVFGSDSDYVKHTFLHFDGFGNYTLKEEVDTQRKVDKYLKKWNADDFTAKIRHGLYDLISNVILFEVAGSHGKQFHFRFAVSSTTSFQYLNHHTQQQLDSLYVNYFFRRQDDFWMKEALQKLPALKRVTNMLVCGEDLGLVPACLPDVMKQLGLLSLEIQRMPKDSSKQFFHPNDAPYLSVVTPSTHDMSTVRGWWEEDKQATQQFYNHQLGYWGQAPNYCEPWINKAIIAQHLHSPAMWSIFQLQDLLGSDGELRRQNPNDERINIPANPKHYWRYRMHLSLEQLLAATAFNTDLQNQIKNSGR